MNTSYQLVIGPIDGGALPPDDGDPGLRPEDVMPDNFGTSHYYTHPTGPDFGIDLVGVGLNEVSPF